MPTRAACSDNDPHKSVTRSLIGSSRLRCSGVAPCLSCDPLCTARSANGHKGGGAIRECARRYRYLNKCLICLKQVRSSILTAFNKPPVVFRGRDAARKMVKALHQEEDAIMKRVEQTVPLRMTAADVKSFGEATVCYLCKGEFVDIGEVDSGSKVRDHCHLTGNYRGALHSGCNLASRTNRRKFRIPVIFHNLKSFDGHIIVQGLRENDDVSVIPTTMEKYLTISLGPHLQLIDSLAFLPSSLRTLVESLPPEDFKCCREAFSDALMPHVMSKQTYPYDYMDSFARFDEKNLPPPEAFYNSLTQEMISAEDYASLETVWKVFDLKSLGDLHDHYVRCDVLQLADVWESFRQRCRKVDGLDPNHYFTLPQLAWDSALLKCGVTLGLIEDVDLHQMIETGIRGGVSIVNKRYSEADNPYQNHSFTDAAAITANSPDTEHTYLLDVDCNNLYGSAMMGHLPVGGWKWLTRREIDDLDVAAVSAKSKIGFILEVDLSYPESLHADHNDLPCAPEHFSVPTAMLSPHQRQLLETSGARRDPTGNAKLIPNLYPKKRYVCHYRTLQLYLALGLKLVKVHRVVKFTQAPFLRKYIRMNTALRKKAKSKFEKDFWKLRNNAVFGKTIEGKRNRRKVDICTNARKFKKLVAMPAFQSMRRFRAKVVGVERQVTNVRLDRPIGVGFAVLELSKLIMWDFHYRVVKKIFPHSTLCYSDTDSLLYEVRCNDLYRALLPHSSHFDFSDYPVDHPLFSQINHKRPGKFHDELSGMAVHGFCGLRSKMYAIKLGNNSAKKAAKGVNRAVVEKQMTFQTYRDTLVSQRQTTTTNRGFRSFCHNISLIETKKLGLSCFDDKRYINADGQTTLAHGHFEIPQRIPRPKICKRAAKRAIRGNKSARFAEGEDEQPNNRDQHVCAVDDQRDLSVGDGVGDCGSDVGGDCEVPVPRQKSHRQTFQSFLANLPTDRWMPTDPGYCQSSIDSAELLLENDLIDTDDEDADSRHRSNPFVFDECDEATRPKKLEKHAKYVMCVHRFYSLLCVLLETQYGHHVRLLMTFYLHARASWTCQ
jgi:hypothetical protein